MPRARQNRRCTSPRSARLRGRGFPCRCSSPDLPCNFSAPRRHTICGRRTGFMQCPESASPYCDVRRFDDRCPTSNLAFYQCCEWQLASSLFARNVAAEVGEALAYVLVIECLAECIRERVENRLRYALVNLGFGPQLRPSCNRCAPRAARLVLWLRYLFGAVRRPSPRSLRGARPLHTRRPSSRQWDGPTAFLSITRSPKTRPARSGSRALPAPQATRSPCLISTVRLSTAGSICAGSRVTTTSITVGRSRSSIPRRNAPDNVSGSSTRMPPQPIARAIAA